MHKLRGRILTTAKMGVHTLLQICIVTVSCCVFVDSADYRAYQKKFTRKARPSKIWRDSQPRPRPTHQILELTPDGKLGFSLADAQAMVAAATQDDASSRANALAHLGVAIIDEARDIVGGLRIVDEAVRLDPNDSGLFDIRSRTLAKLIEFAVVHPYEVLNYTVLKEAIYRTSFSDFRFLDPHQKCGVGPKLEKVHMVVQLWQLFLRAKHYVQANPNTGYDFEGAARQLVINCLKAGLRADVLFNWGFQDHPKSLGGTPLGHLASWRMDVEFFEAFLDAGHLLVPSPYLTRNLDLDQLAGVPKEHYRLVFNRSAHGITLLHLLANGAASVLYMRKIYTAYNDHVKHGTPFFDALAKQKLDRMWPYSKTLSDIFHRVNDGAPLFDTNLTRAVLSQSDGELEERMLKRLLEQPSWKIEDHMLLSHPDNFSPLMLAAGMNRWMTVRMIREHSAEQMALFPDREAAIKSALRTAVEARSTYANRTALHAASLFFGQDTNLFREMLATLELATGDTTSAHTLMDAFGKSAFDYDNRSSIATPYSAETDQAIACLLYTSPSPRDRG